MEEFLKSSENHVTVLKYFQFQKQKQKQQQQK